jgi:hypothetical protein
MSAKDCSRNALVVMRTPSIFKASAKTRNVAVCDPTVLEIVAQEIS